MRENDKKRQKAFTFAIWCSFSDDWFYPMTATKSSLFGLIWSTLAKTLYFSQFWKKYMLLCIFYEHPKMSRPVLNFVRQNSLTGKISCISFTWPFRRMQPSFITRPIIIADMQKVWCQRKKRKWTKYHILIEQLACPS